MIRLHHRLRRFRSDDGIGLIEVAVALGVLFVALLALVYTASIALNDIGLARQRQGANSLANSLIEQVRGLAYAEVTQKGLRSSDLVGDPNVSTCTVNSVSRECYGGEAIVHSSGVSDLTPLRPNVDTFTPTGAETQYTRAVYVTDPDGDPDVGPFRVTVMVTWGQIFRPGADDFVQSQTLVYSPEGCLDPAVSPFSGPCEPEHLGTATVPAGGVSFTRTLGAETVTGDLQTIETISRANEQQTASISGSTRGSRVALNGQGAGGELIESAADTDPATTTIPFYESTTLPGGSTSPVSTTSQGMTMTLSTGSTSGSSTSATAAGEPFGAGTQTCPIGPAPPSSQTDGDMCGHGRALQGGALSAALDANVSLAGISVDLGTATLASIPAPTDPSWAFTDRTSAANADGFVQARASRNIGGLTVGALPNLIGGPLGWQGSLISMGAYTDTVQAEAGSPSTEPARTVSSTTIQYWNGSDYTSLIVPTNGTASFTSDLVFDTTLLGTGVHVEMHASMVAGAGTGGTTCTPDPCGTGPQLRTTARATVNSPLTGTVQYLIRVTDILSGTTATVLDIEVGVDFGQLSADTAYTPVP